MLWEVGRRDAAGHGAEEVDEPRVVLQLGERWAFLLEEAGAVVSRFIGEGVDKGGGNVECVSL